MSALNVNVPDYCVIKDAPDAALCGEPRHTTVRVEYTFTPPDEEYTLSQPDGGKFVFELPMCKDHAKVMWTRVEQDLAQISFS